MVLSLYSYFVPSVKFNKLITPIVFVIVPALFLDTIAEFNKQAYSIFFLKDIVNLVFVSSLLSLFYSKLMRARHVFMLVSYSIIISLMISLPLSMDQDNFIFESFFLKVELVLLVLIMAVGTLVSPRQNLVILTINLIFIFCCVFLMNGEYPLEKFSFYGILISGTGIMTYILHDKFLELNANLRAANAKILHQNDELKKLNASKNQLFRIIGHDLRTPFAQLTMLVDLINETEDLEQRKELRKMIKESATNGITLLDKLIAWAKIQSNESKIKLKKQRVSLVVDEAFKYVKQNCIAKEINVISEVDETIEICMDVEMMETVMRNLICNAVKFSHRGKTIFVKSSKKKNKQRIEVIDHGVGMSEEMLQKLFKSDENISNLGTDNEKGSGLGLNICKALIENQGGTISINSTLGVGTVIAIEMPINC